MPGGKSPSPSIFLKSISMVRQSESMGMELGVLLQAVQLGRSRNRQNVADVAFGKSGFLINLAGQKKAIVAQMAHNVGCFKQKH